MSNHVIDPSFFDRAVDIFSFDYDLYVHINTEVDDTGRLSSKFEHHVVRGSLQPSSTKFNQSLNGNTQTKTYGFYCKSDVRFKVGDFFFYNNIWLYIDEVQEYDEYGVRQGSATMINLVDYNDLAEFVKYEKGQIKR